MGNCVTQGKGESDAWEMARYTKERLLSGMAGWQRSQRCRNSSGSFAKLTATRPADWAFPRSLGRSCGQLDKGAASRAIAFIGLVGNLDAIHVNAAARRYTIGGFDYVLP
jgi:hypothetical protein